MAPLLTDPLDAGVEASLRRVVHELRARRTRGPFAPTVEVGDLLAVPPGPGVTLDEGIDDAQRVDVVAALLEHRARLAGHPVVWLNRPGGLVWNDADAAWLSATVRAAAEADVPAAFVVVVRTGWCDPRSGVGRTWKRPRQR